MDTYNFLTLPGPAIGPIPAQLLALRTGSYPDYAGWIPLPGVNPRTTFPGPGQIAGTVAVGGDLAMRRVTLLDHLTLKPVAQTWSDPETGEYEFTGLAEGKRYLVICDDYTQTWNAAVADWVEAEK